MYCPKCSAERFSDETSYCSNCGFRLTEVAALMDESIGETVDDTQASPTDSPRRRGLRQSYFIFLAVFVIFTVGGLLQAFWRTDTRYFVIASLILVFVGIFRLAYALFFESGQENISSGSKLSTSSEKNKLLPSSESMPASDFARANVAASPVTRELVPQSVTESTTRSLREFDPQ